LFGAHPLLSRSPACISHATKNCTHDCGDTRSKTTTWLDN
ncbi:major Facilitator Superfamily protein, partial [Chlamydia psittaci 84-8471/1]